jgi:predicted nucleic acid-binding protein
MGLADAALVRLGERDEIRKVFTTDRRDFSLYRPV